MAPLQASRASLIPASVASGSANAPGNPGFLETCRPVGSNRPWQPADPGFQATGCAAPHKTHSSSRRSRAAIPGLSAPPHCAALPRTPRKPKPKAVALGLALGLQIGKANLRAAESPHSCSPMTTPWLVLRCLAKPRGLARFTEWPLPRPSFPARIRGSRSHPKAGRIPAAVLAGPMAALSSMLGTPPRRLPVPHPTCRRNPSLAPESLVSSSPQRKGRNPADGCATDRGPAAF